MKNTKQRLVKFVEELDFNELEDWQMFAMVDGKLAIINPTEQDWKDYYEDKQAELMMDDMKYNEWEMDQI